MGIRDAVSKIRQQIALAPQTINSATTTAGLIIDTARFPANGIIWGAVAHTAGDFTLLLEESDDSGMAGAVTLTDKRKDYDAVTVSAALGVGFLNRVAVISNLRFLRASIVSANSPNADLMALYQIMPDIIPGD